MARSLENHIWYLIVQIDEFIGRLGIHQMVLILFLSKVDQVLGFYSLNVTSLTSK